MSFDVHTNHNYCVEHRGTLRLFGRRNMYSFMNDAGVSESDSVNRPAEFSCTSVGETSSGKCTVSNSKAPSFWQQPPQDTIAHHNNNVKVDVRSAGESAGRVHGLDDSSEQCVAEIKQKLGSTMTDWQAARFRDILSGGVVDDRHPSPTAVPDVDAVLPDEEIALTRFWQEELPQAIFFVVSGVDNTLRRLAGHAAGPTGRRHFIDASENAVERSQTIKNMILPIMTKVLSRVVAQSQRRSRFSWSNRQSRSSPRSHSRSRSRSRLRSYCSYHYRYGNRSYRCQSPCGFRRSKN